LVGELGLLIAATNDNQLKVFAIENAEEGLQLIPNSILIKESAHRAV